MDRISRFAHTARACCQLLESRPTTLMRHLAAVQLAVLSLPDAEPEPNAPAPADPAASAALDLPLDAIWVVEDPLADKPEAPVARSLNADLGALRADLRAGLSLYDKRFPRAAASAWQQRYQTRWGQHLLDAQRALYLWSRQQQPVMG